MSGETEAGNTGSCLLKIGMESVPGQGWNPLDHPGSCSHKSLWEEPTLWEAKIKLEGKLLAATVLTTAPTPVIQTFFWFLKQTKSILLSQDVCSYGSPLLECSNCAPVITGFLLQVQCKYHPLRQGPGRTPTEVNPHPHTRESLCPSIVLVIFIVLSQHLTISCSVHSPTSQPLPTVCKLQGTRIMSVSFTAVSPHAREGT